MQEENIERQAQSLARTIWELQHEEKKNWISWKQVAKREEGSDSEELIYYWEGIAYLKTSYFRTSEKPRKVSLTEKGEELAQATPQAPANSLDQVVRSIKNYAGRLRDIPLTIQDDGVRRIAETERGQFVYNVFVEPEDTPLPTDAPVRIRLGPSKPVEGRIVSQSEDQELLSLLLEQDVGYYQYPAHLFVDRSFLLNKLAESIDDLTKYPSLGHILTTGNSLGGRALANDDSKQVVSQLAAEGPPWARFLWGPPGSGKTYGIARLVHQLIRDAPEERILLVAPSNLAADVALSHVVAQLKDSKESELLRSRRVLRYGNPRKQDILGQPELLGSWEEHELNRDIERISEEIRELHEKEYIDHEALAFKQAQFVEFQESRKQSVFSHVQNCSIVVTTTTQAYMPSSPIRNQQWHSVIVDETPMVAPAVCLYLSSLALQRFLLAGDPQQLGPVFEESPDHDESVKEWLGHDVYAFSGLTVEDTGQRQIQTGDRRLARITAQRRCDPAIWNQISHLYHGVSTNIDRTWREQLKSLPPSPGEGIVLVDMADEAADAACSQASKSWENIRSAESAVRYAELVFSEAEGLSETLSIAVITPYRAQNKRLSRLIRDKNLRQVVSVGTIHQFQGSEADIVIFDIVDGPGREKLGKLLRSEEGNRLVNTALSRARGKFILLADVEWCLQSRRLKTNSLLQSLITGYS